MLSSGGDVGRVASQRLRDADVVALRIVLDHIGNSVGMPQMRDRNVPVESVTSWSKYIAMTSTWWVSDKQD